MLQTNNFSPLEIGDANKLENKENKNFQEVVDFSSLSNKENISKDFYLQQVKIFKEQTGKLGEEIFISITGFLKDNNLTSVKLYLATMFAIQNIIAIKKKNAKKIINVLKDKKQVLLLKLIKGFCDNVYKALDTYKKEADIAKKQKILANQGATIESSKKNRINYLHEVLDYFGIKHIEFGSNKIKLSELEIGNKNLLEKYFGNSWKEKTLDDLVIRYYKEKVENLIKNKVPQYQEKINKKAKEIQKNYPDISADKAYLISIAWFIKHDKNFSSQLQLDTTEQAILSSVEQEYSNLQLDKIVSQTSIKNQIEDFVNTKTDFDSKIKESFDLPKNLGLNLQKLLSKKYKGIVDKFLEKIVEETNGNISKDLLQNDYSKYLKGQQTKYKALFEKIGQELYEYFINQTNSFVKDYKQIALKEYTRSIFTLFAESVGFKNITKEFNENDFNIEKNGKIELNFKYKDTPLKFIVNPDGKIYMTNYLAKKNQDPDKIISNKNGAYELKETRLNTFFTFVSLNEILTPDKIDFNNILAKKGKLKDILYAEFKNQVNGKIAENNKLGNKELMESEVKYQMSVQYLTHKLLSSYRPPVEKSYLDGEKGKIAEGGIFNLLQRFENTVNTKEKTFSVLNKLLLNERFNQLIQTSLGEREDKITTSDLFKKLGFFTSDGKLNLGKIYKFTNLLEKISSESDLKSLPPVENFTWKLEDNKLKLGKSDENEFSLFEQLKEVPKANLT